MATTTSDPSYPPSETGYWDVKVSRVWDYNGCYFKPGMDRITVNETTLNAMLAEADLVANVVAAD